jgi:integration host factor subunit beta
MNLVHYEFKGEVMNRSNLIEALTKDTGLPKGKAEEVVKTVFNTMANALADGDRVQIRGFGTFKVKNYDGYTGHNPKTGKAIKVKPKKLPFFKCSRELKERVDTYRKSKRRR